MTLVDEHLSPSAAGRQVAGVGILVTRADHPSYPCTISLNSSTDFCRNLNFVKDLAAHS